MSVVASVTTRGVRDETGLYDTVTLHQDDQLKGEVKVKISKESPTHDEALVAAGYDHFIWDFQLGNPTVIPLEKLFFNGHNAPVNIIDSVDDFLPEDDLGASRYRYEYEQDRPLDALLLNKGSETLIVHLHGATERKYTKLPRFERLASLASEPVTSMFFSDPTLHVDADIQLTWYTGWPGANVQQDIATIVKHTASSLGVKNIVIAGSSGGGFATLQISSLIPGSWALPINGQTSIHKYYVGGDPKVRGVQRAYIRHVHPEIAEGPIEKMDLTPDWTLKLGDETSPIRRYSRPVDNKILFVQNENDWHFEQHWKPFIEACEKGGNSKNVELETYNGPKAHVAPDAETFKKSIGRILQKVEDGSLGSKAGNWDPRYEAQILHYENKESIDWSALSPAAGRRYRIVVEQEDKLPLDMLYIPRDSRKLLVGLHGAEQRSTMQYPKFQFVRSLEQTRSESLLFIADSTLLLNENLTVGWMAGDGSTDVASEYAATIRGYSHHFGEQGITLIGHSAGGTAAIRIGAQIPNSLVVAVNPQLSAELHRPWLLTRLRTSAFPHLRTNQALMTLYRERLDLNSSLLSRAPGFNLFWFSHVDDELSFKTYPHFPVLCDIQGLPPTGGINRYGDHILACKWEVSNPNKHALPGSVLPFLKYALGETSGDEINIQK